MRTLEQLLSTDIDGYNIDTATMTIEELKMIQENEDNPMIDASFWQDCDDELNHRLYE